MSNLLFASFHKITFVSKNYVISIKRIFIIIGYSYSNTISNEYFITNSQCCIVFFSIRPALIFILIEINCAEEELKKQNKILEEADVEEEKRDLITREIGKFREIMKVSNAIMLMEALPQFGNESCRTDINE